MRYCFMCVQTTLNYRSACCFNLDSNLSYLHKMLLFSNKMRKYNIYLIDSGNENDNYRHCYGYMYIHICRFDK